MALPARGTTTFRTNLSVKCSGTPCGCQEHEHTFREHSQTLTSHLHPDISRVHRTCHLLIIGPLDDRSRVGKNRQLISIDDEAKQELVDGYLPDRAQPLRQVRPINLISSSATSHLHRVTSTEACTARPTERIKEFVIVQAAGWAIRLARQLYAFARILPHIHPEHGAAHLLAFQ